MSERSGLRGLQSHSPMFIMPWTLVHVIDETSPLFGHTAETLKAARARIFVTVEARDQALAAGARHERLCAETRPFRHAFRGRGGDGRQGNTTADLSRISLLEPDVPV